jgi:hypothetical protein
MPAAKKIDWSMRAGSEELYGSDARTEYEGMNVYQESFDCLTMTFVDGMAACEEMIDGLSKKPSDVMSDCDAMGDWERTSE